METLGEKSLYNFWMQRVTIAKNRNLLIDIGVGFELKFHKFDECIYNITLVDFWLRDFLLFR